MSESYQMLDSFLINVLIVVTGLAFLLDLFQNIWQRNVKTASFNQNVCPRRTPTPIRCSV